MGENEKGSEVAVLDVCPLCGGERYVPAVNGATMLFNRCWMCHPAVDKPTVDVVVRQCSNGHQLTVAVPAFFFEEWPPPLKREACWRYLTRIPWPPGVCCVGGSISFLRLLRRFGSWGGFSWARLLEMDLRNDDIDGLGPKTRADLHALILRFGVKPCWPAVDENE